jgi:hypothetical protein
LYQVEPHVGFVKGLEGTCVVLAQKEEISFLVERHTFSAGSLFFMLCCFCLLYNILTTPTTLRVAPFVAAEQTLCYRSPELHKAALTVIDSVLAT